ncbi:MAG: FAD-dependent monooxygenase [Terriglobales bacterium]
MPVNNSPSGPVPIIVVGAGLAGTTAAAVLGQQGWHVVLVDPRPSYPRVFKAEKIEPDQAEMLRKFGLLECLLPHTGLIREIKSYFNGHFFGLTPIEQYGIYYSDMVNPLRAHLPASVEFKLGRVVQISNSADLQRVKLAGGEELTARLLVLACPLSPEIQAGLRLKRVLIQKDQSLAIAFTIAPANGGPFPFDAVTYHATSAASGVDYLSLFRIGESMRGNLFAFRAASEPWVSEFIREPIQGLERCMPKLRRAIGEYRVISKVETGRVDLYRMEGDPQPGVVMIGDAAQNSCPATGKGLTKIFTDVDVLSECVPVWFGSAGMGSERMMSFSQHPRKQATDAKALHDAFYCRHACTGQSLRWRVHRLRLHLTMQFKRPTVRPAFSK